VSDDERKPADVKAIAAAAQSLRRQRGRTGEPFVSPAARALVAIVVTAASGIVRLITFFYAISEVNRILASEQIRAAEKAAARLEEFALFIGLQWAVAFAVFLAWQYRAYKNLAALRIWREFSPGAVVAFYFLPFVNFVLPCITMMELRNGSRPDPGEATERRPSVLVTVWWLTFLGGIAFPFLARVQARFIAHAIVFQTAAVILTCVLAWMISRDQLARHQSLSKAAADDEEGEPPCSEPE